MRNKDQLSWLSPLAILSLVIAVAIVFLGVNFMLHPHVGAAGYGVPVASTDADTFLKAKGLRDVASGIVLFGLLAFASKRAVGLFLLAMTVIPFGDAILVAMTGNAPTYAIPMHGTTGLVMLIMGILMMRQPAPASAP